MWHKFIPLKVAVFAGKCALGCGEHETVSHLFLECAFFSKILTSVPVVYNNISSVHLNSIVGLISGNKGIEFGLGTILFTCSWSNWKARKAKTYQDKKVPTDKIVDQVGLFSWNWLRTKSTVFKYELDQWWSCSLACLDVMGVANSGT